MTDTLRALTRAAAATRGATKVLTQPAVVDLSLDVSQIVRLNTLNSHSVVYTVKARVICQLCLSAGEKLTSLKTWPHFEGLGIGRGNCTGTQSRL